MRKGDINDMNITEPEIEVIGASIIDVLVRPAREEVFESGSYEAEDIKMSIGADALNEATILSRMGKKVRLETKKKEYSLARAVSETMKQRESMWCLWSRMVIGIS